MSDRKVLVWAKSLDDPSPKMVCDGLAEPAQWTRERARALATGESPRLVGVLVRLRVRPGVVSAKDVQRRFAAWVEARRFVLAHGEGALAEAAERDPAYAGRLLAAERIGEIVEGGN